MKVLFEHRSNKPNRSLLVTWKPRSEWVDWEDKSPWAFSFIPDFGYLCVLGLEISVW
jgi:hypothetical protein